MPLEKYRSRRWEIYFPSEEFLEKWKERAKAAQMPLSKWIFETVEAHMDEDTVTAQELAMDRKHFATKIEFSGENSIVLKQNWKDKKQKHSS